MACDESCGYLKGGTYALYGKSLIIAFDNDLYISMEHPKYEAAIGVVIKYLCNLYNNDIYIWDMDKFKTEIPIKVQEKTGRVDLVNTFNNRF